MARRAKPVKEKAEAKRPPARKSPKGEGSGIRDLEQRLAEALKLKTEALQREAEAQEHQTATAQILRVIASSPTDAIPTFQAIASAAARLCSARDTGVIRFDGTLMHLMANEGFTTEERDALRAQFPRPADRTTVTGRAIVTRAVAHVADITQDPDYGAPTLLFMHTVLSVPMLRDGQPIGAITVTRHEAKPFSLSQVALLQTFADQAVIAIENVRLFTELQASNRELTESLEQQTATADILQVISRSQTDVQPVFAAVATSAARLCDAFDAAIFQIDGDVLRLVAHKGPIPPDPLLPLAEGTVGGRVIRERRAIHVADVQAETEEYPASSQFARNRGFRTLLSVPLLRGGDAIGVIAIRRTESRPFSDRQVELLKTFADQAVIAIENVRLFNELQSSNRELTTALDTQTATSDILRVISRSQTDVQPVFDAIVASAVRLLEADSGLLTRIAGDQIEIAALTSTDPAGDAILRAAYPLSRHSDRVHARVIRDRAPLNVADAQTDPRLPDVQHATARARGYRSQVAVPLLRHDEALGAIAVTRHVPGGFTDDEIALLQTFADQAVIAIENARLFNETKEALERQTATSEILQVISSSPTDVQPVFDAIVRSAVQLCNGFFGVMTRYDGRLATLVAHHNMTPEAVDGLRSIRADPPTSDTATGRALLTGAVDHTHDLASDPASPVGAWVARIGGFRTNIAVPMLRDGQPVGTISVARRERQPFSESEIALLQTFADQAVIAIENVRLFTELQASNRELTTALETQTATSDILRVISRSQTDVQPVFETIARSTVRLCEAARSTVWLPEGDLFRAVARYQMTPEGNVVSAPRGEALDADSLPSRAIRDHQILRVNHVPENPTVPPTYRERARTRGYRSLMAVPMMREGIAVGVITVVRPAAVEFTDQQASLVKTFADQAVIAIENVRLFTELQTRTAELQRSVRQLTALGEVGQAVSSSLDLETVLTTIVSRAVQLSGLDGGVVFEYDAGTETFVQRAAIGTANRATAAREGGIRRGEGVVGRTALTLRPVQIPDISVIGAYEGRIREDLIAAGVRALVAVPILREGRLIGGLAVNRNQPGEVSSDTVELLETFAAQSALAIDNARLFREIEEKGRELEAASQHKSEFLANMSHELRTPLNAIIGFSEVLTARMFGELNEKQDEYLKDIYASGQHLLSLINDILDLSKVEAGRMELEPEDFDLPGAIDNALTLVRERSGRRGITLGREVDQRVGMIRADERKVKQVLLNLLSNAIKFTLEGGRIDVRAAMNENMVEVSVSDTGVGIAPEDQEAVFEEFRQVGTADKKVEGTGLGLALSRKFIELHGGRIWVTSQLGEGATFTFTLPVRRSE